MTSNEDWRQIGGPDALDAIIPPAPARGGPSWLQPLRTRAVLGLTPVVAPAVVFVPIGAVLGPSFTNVLNPTVLGYLDAVVAVALAVLGVFAGLALDLRGERNRRILTAASVEAIVTLLAVGGAFLVLLGSWGLPLGLPHMLVALTLGLCASVSSAGSDDDASPAHAIAAAIALVDDVLPIVVSGVLVVMLGSVSPVPVWSAVAWSFRTIVLGIAVGTAGWLLFERAHSRAERNVFIAGIVALLGGTSAFLGLSPLLAGLMAGLLWVWLPGQAGHGILSGLAWEIFGSFAFGGIVGACFAFYLRYVRREVTIVLLGVAILLSQVGGALHFEPLLAALGAGLVVENIAPPEGDALRLAVERGALPILVLFFAAAGANLHLGALAEVGVFAVAIAALRMALIHATAKAGDARADLGGEPPALAWMGLVSQAGVTLGLAILINAEFPDWGGKLYALIVSMITLHETIGPILFRAALTRAGEVGRMDLETGEHRTPGVEAPA